MSDPWIESVRQYIKPDDEECDCDCWRCNQGDHFKDHCDEDTWDNMGILKQYAYVGLNDGSMEPLRFDTLEEAEAWIAAMEKIDGNAVRNGDFYIDSTEEMMNERWRSEYENT